MRIVYTTILGESTNRNRSGQLEKYILQDPRVKDDSVQWVCITDRDDLRSRVWEISKIEPPEDPRLFSKLIKLLPHVYLTRGAETMWIDATCRLRIKASEVFDAVGDCDLGLIRSTVRDTALEEADAILKHKGDTVDRQQIEEQAKRYAEKGYGELPLYHGAIIVRRDTAAACKFSQLWLQETRKWCLRDQPSIAMAAKESGASVYEISQGLKGDVPFSFRREWCRG